MAEDVCVRETNGEGEARQIMAFLEAHGIPSRLRGESTRLTHGMTLDGLGAVRILVLADDAERARELLAQADSGALSLESTPDEAAGD